MAFVYGNRPVLVFETYMYMYVSFLINLFNIFALFNLFNHYFSVFVVHATKFNEWIEMSFWFSCTSPLRYSEEGGLI